MTLSQFLANGVVWEETEHTESSCVLQRRPPKLSELYGSCVAGGVLGAVELCLVSNVGVRTACVTVDRLDELAGVALAEGDANGWDLTSADEAVVDGASGNRAAATLATGSGGSVLMLESGIGFGVRFEVRARTTAREIPKRSNTPPMRRTTCQRRPLAPCPKAANARLEDVTATVVSMGAC